MTKLDRGSKHICPSCMIKYYDLGKQIVTCPKCGTKPVIMKAPKAPPPARKTGRPAFRRFP